MAPKQIRTFSGLWLWLGALWHVGNRQTFAKIAYLLEAGVLASGCYVCAGWLAPGRPILTLSLNWHSWCWQPLAVAAAVHLQSSSALATPSGKCEARDATLHTAAAPAPADASWDSGAEPQ